ncbi:unnamed protein product, partial [Brenthis ino]
MVRFTHCTTFILIWINILFVNAVRKDICEKCVKIENCPMFAHMNKHQKQMWLEQVPCDVSQNGGGSSIYGFSSIAKGDYVCCPNSNVWGIKNGHGKGNNNNLPQESIRPNENNGAGNFENPNSQNLNLNPQPQENYGNQIKPIDQNYGNQLLRPGNQNIYNSVNPQPGDINQNIYNNQGGRPNAQIPYSQPPTNQINPGDYDNPQGQPDGQDVYGNPQTGLYNQGIYDQQNPDSRYPNNGINTAGNPNQGFQNNQYPTPQNPNQMGVLPGQIQNQNPYYQGPNAYPQQQQQNPYLNNGDGNSFNGVNAEQQCAVQSSLPPDPATGCCGKDMSDSDRITGGKETELDQFPWTVLLKVTFDYGNKQAAFNCGGSLISPKYVLTAGHCVFETGADILDIEITLAEYDKRTFPRDCKSVMGVGKKCIDNIVMHAEDVIRHPKYDDDRLHNDIALIRLHGYAPYTRFIRSICLPPIDIDNPNFSNLPLAVAGWGRNGPYVTDIKQSTVVHLVPHDECQKSYPHLTRSHLCAAGRTGEDTCKGDSGGPLMMLYRGSYYVIGVVSGKRADSPCGTSVPSLYTNVFQYVEWINSNIKN